MPLSTPIPVSVRGELAGVRPHRWAAVSYRAYRVTPMFKNPHNGKTGNHTTAIDIGEPESLQAAVQAAQGRCFHRDHLAIHETDEAGNVRVHVYAIKRKSAPSYEHDRNHIPRRVHTLYAVEVCVLGGEVLE